MQKDRWPPIFAFGVKFSLAQGRQSTLFSFNLREEDSRGREREREREGNAFRREAPFRSSTFFSLKLLSTCGISANN